MSYHISDPSDISIHRRFHRKFLSGIDFPETSDTNISIVTPSSSSAEQKKVREVLEVVDSELSAAAIPEKNLWAGGYKVFLYVAQGKVVGLLLAERIESAFLARGIGSVELGERRRAVMGVSRVWTAKEWRRMGVAKKLLDEACERFVYGMRLGRGEVAFSQPTESGGWLARGWVYGKAEGDGGAREDTAKSSGGDGWLVYVERE